MQAPYNRLAVHYIVLGGAMCAISIGTMLVVRGTATALDGQTRALLAVSLGVLVTGISVVVLGVKRYLKTVNVVDAAEPLAPVCDGSQPAAAQPGAHAAPFPYGATDLETILDVQRPFIETPRTLLDRMLFQLFPDIQYSSPVLQREARVHFARAAGAALCFGLFLLLALSVLLGIFGTGSGPVAGWSAVAYFCCLTVLGFSRAPRNVAPLVAIAVSLPVLIGLINGVKTLPTVPTWALALMIVSSVLPVLQFGLFFFLLRRRSHAARSSIGVARKDARVQHTLQPVALFQQFSAVLDGHRKEGMPNRCYRYTRDIGNVSGARSGAFSGRMLWETHADVQDYAGHDTSTPAWGAVALVVVGVFGALWSLASDQGRFEYFLIGALLIRYGLVLLRTAELFTRECLLSSWLVSFAVEGTWATTKISAGNQFRDSLHSSSEEDKVDANVRLLVARVQSSVFAVPGAALPFRNQHRHIVGLAPDESFAESLDMGLQNAILAKTNISEVVLPNQATGSSIYGRVAGKQTPRIQPPFSAGASAAQ